MSEHTLAATRPLSPVMIFTSTPSRSSWAMEAPASAFGRSAKVRKPSSVSPCSSAAVSAVDALGRAGGHGHHPGPFGEQRLQRRPGAVGDVHAPVEHHLGGALGDHERLAVRVLHQHRGQLPLVVEGKDAEPLVARRPSMATSCPAAAPGADHRAWSSAFPPTGPSSVTAASLQTSPSSSGRSLVAARRRRAPARR